MPELEQQLAALGTALDWPSTPNLAGVIQIHLPARRGGRVPLAAPGWGGTVGRSAGSRWAVAAAAAVLIAAGLLAFPPSREAIPGWGNVHPIFPQGPPLPTPAPQPPRPFGERP